MKALTNITFQPNLINPLKGKTDVCLVFFALILFLADTVAIQQFWTDRLLAGQRVEQSHQIMHKLQDVWQSIQDLEPAEHNYSRTGNIVFLKPYYKDEIALCEDMDTLTQLLLDNPEQQTRLSELTKLINATLDLEPIAVGQNKHYDADASQASVKSQTANQLMTRIRTQIAVIRSAENALLALKNSQVSDCRNRLLLAIIVLTIIALASLLKGLFLAKESAYRQGQKDRAYEQLEALSKRLNLQLADLLLAQEQTKKALNARSEFLATISHELRTPLAGIIGSTELLLGMPLPEEQRDLIRTAKECGEILLNRVSDILDFSKMDAGKINLESIDFNLQTVVETTVDYLKFKAKQKGLRLKYDIPEDVPRFVNGDPVRLRQVLANLVDNAIKFTDKGAVSIQLRTSHELENHKTIVFSVTDSGIGISPESITSIFDAFVQSDSSTTRKYGGTGLGLAICKQLVELMGGQIRVYSTQGKGSVFWFSVPFTAPPPGTSCIAHEDIPQGLSDVHNSTILIVDDREVNRMITTLQLNKLGYQVEIASNGREAVEAASRNSYALILMDCQMPELDGTEATKIIRSMQAGCLRPVPIVALTAHARPEDRDKCLCSGMNDYIPKPVTLDKLQQVVTRWVKQSSDRESLEASVSLK